MNGDQLNYANIGLMLLSGIVALFLPFELFLFSYIILGPLHYLTELSWLHQRKYFTPGKTDVWILAIMASLILAPTFLKYLIGVWFYFTLGYQHQTLPFSFTPLQLLNHCPYWLREFLIRATEVGRVMIFVTFCSSAILLLIPSWGKRLIAITFALAVGLLLRTNALVYVLFAVFVPTLIHVFVFTGAFVLTGALKQRRLSGFISLAVFVGTAVFLLLFPSLNNTFPNTKVVGLYDTSFFGLNKQIFQSFLHINATHNDVYFTGAGLVITRFIAYAYTYHYLNWFSKTSVIKWHKVPLKSLVRTFTLWILCIALYLFNSTTGVAALYFLSMIHVIFEFPLNVQSFKDISINL